MSRSIRGIIDVRDTGLNFVGQGKRSMRFVRRSADTGARLLLLVHLVAVLICGALIPALADERTINAMGHGVESCQAWLEARKNGSSAGYGDWLLGYLTGVNLWGPTSGRDLLRNRKAQEMIEWVDKYCTAFPNETIESGARQLILDLGRRAKESGL
jgi:hypothetical protein